MPLNRQIPHTSPAAKALLMAGLSVFCALGGPAFAEEIPARQAIVAVSPTPNPSSTPIPSVRPEELLAAEARFQAALGDGLKKASSRAELMDTDLAGLRERVRSLTGSYEGARLQLEAQGTQAAAFGLALEEAEKKLAEGLRRISEVHDQIESKGARMEGLLDLVNTLKRDLNDDSHEIAELKNEYAELKKSTQAPTEEQDWWGQLTSWRYMPLCGAVLGAVALGVAASHR
jgi:hypothetical protein